MRIGLVQINPTVGDLSGNAARIRAAVTGAPPADLFVTSEMALTGYPARDLLLEPAFIARTRDVAAQLARDLAATAPVLVGLPIENPSHAGRPLSNAAALLRGGAIERLFVKSLLPTYDVFDEDRYFEPGAGLEALDVAGRRAAISVCEDVWNDRDFWQRPRYLADPIDAVQGLGADRPRQPVGLAVFGGQAGGARGNARRARPQSRCPRRLRQPGRRQRRPDLRRPQRGPRRRMAASVARAAAFAEAVVVVRSRRAGRRRVDAGQSAAKKRSSARSCSAPPTTRASAGSARRCSASRAASTRRSPPSIAAEALGREHVLGVLMPSPFSSQGSIDDSLALAERLGIRTLTLPIAGVMDAFERTLAGAFAGRTPDVTEENIQARARGNLLMALSNKFGSLLLTTGNKSELSVGYCTLYGDMSGGLAVIADLPKTRVYSVCDWVNRNARGDSLGRS